MVACSAISSRSPRVTPARIGRSSDGVSRRSPSRQKTFAVGASSTVPSRGDHQGVVGARGDRAVLRGHVLGVAGRLGAREGTGRPGNRHETEPALTQGLERRVDLGRGGDEVAAGPVEAKRQVLLGAGADHELGEPLALPGGAPAGPHVPPSARTARDACRGGMAGRRRRGPSRRRSARAAGGRRRPRRPAGADRRPHARRPRLATAHTSITREPGVAAPSPTTPRSRLPPPSPRRSLRRPTDGSRPRPRRRCGS